MAKLLSGESVAIKKLLPDIRDEGASNPVRDIARRALSNLEEKGLHTLFLSLGMATWPSSDGGREAEAAVLLVPVALENKGRGSQSFQLTRTGAVQVNLVLLHVLETQLGITTSSDELIPYLLGDDEGE